MDVFWTDHLFEILGIPGDEAPPIEDALDVYHKADLPVVRRAIESALSSGEPFDIEVRFWRADDELRWLHILGVPETEDGDVVSLRGAAQDITERKTYQHELEASHERLEQFASTVSHDLKKPLSTVTSYLQLLERRYKDELDDDAEEFIDIAVGSTMRMRELLDGITTEYTNIDAEMDSLQPVDLDTVLEGVLIDLKTKIDRNDAEITADSLPRVEGEATQFYQLFLNLIDNAIKYSGEEPPKIEISANRGDEMWVISIRDEGIGIDTDDHDFVFDVFHRLHDDERIPGTGIGLTLCKRIVERHDGDIWIESELGEGSTVSFTLPPADDRTVE